MARWAAALLDLFFPPRCVGCGQRGAWLCRDCVHGLAAISPPVCPHCGKPADSAGKCWDCRRIRWRIDGIRSPYYFEGALRQMVHEFKYNDRRCLAEPLSRLLLAYLAENPLPAEVLVPVPLHPRRLRERGYNQALLLAQPLEKAIGLPVVDGCLARVIDTQEQMRLPASQRRANVYGAFACADGRLVGRRVLLVDDVCTTGATLDACALALKESGVRSAWGLVVARAR